MNNFKLVIYVKNVLGALAGFATRFVNVLLGGDPRQTLSARTYIEWRRGSRFWTGMRFVINGIYFWETDHVRKNWEYQVAWADEVKMVLKGLK